MTFVLRIVFMQFRIETSQNIQSTIKETHKMSGTQIFSHVMDCVH